MESASKLGDASAGLTCQHGLSLGCFQRVRACASPALPGLCPGVLPRARDVAAAAARGSGGCPRSAWRRTQSGSGRLQPRAASDSGVHWDSGVQWENSGQGDSSGKQVTNIINWDSAEINRVCNRL